jgi:hypothetical protein
MKLQELASAERFNSTALLESGNATLRAKLTDDECLVLALLIHDKGHIMARGNHDSDLDSAINKLKMKSTIPLYRGVSKKELAEIIAGEADHYLSFSEDRNVAKGFGANVITLQPGAVGLCYWKWGIADNKALAKKYGAEWAEDQDIQFMIDSFEKEKEWVFPFETKLTQVGPLEFKNDTTRTSRRKAL